MKKHHYKKKTLTLGTVAYFNARRWTFIHRFVRATRGCCIAAILAQAGSACLNSSIVPEEFAIPLFSTAAAVLLAEMSEDEKERAVARYQREQQEAAQREQEQREASPCRYFSPEMLEVPEAHATYRHQNPAINWAMDLNLHTSVNSQADIPHAYLEMLCAALATSDSDLVRQEAIFRIATVARIHLCSHPPDLRTDDCLDVVDWLKQENLLSLSQRQELEDWASLERKLA